MGHREPLEYMKELLEDITFAIENEDSKANHTASDLVNLKHVIEVLKGQREMVMKQKDDERALLSAQKVIHELQVFKYHANLHLPDMMYNKIERETGIHLLREKADV